MLFRSRHRAGRRLLRGPRGGGPRCNSLDGLGRPDRAAGAPGRGRGRPRFRDRQQLARERTVMLNRSTIWAVVFLIATFAAGIAVGGGGRALWVRHASAASLDRERGLDRMMDELNEGVRLDPPQRGSVRGVLQRHPT